MKRFLTLHQANLLRKLRESSHKKYTQKVLAKMFAVSIGSVKDILAYRSYISNTHYHNKLTDKQKKDIKSLLEGYPRNKRGKNKLRKQLAENLGVSRTMIVNVELDK